MQTANLKPEFAPLGKIPTLPQRVFSARQKQLQTRLEQNGFEAVCIYADREHAANLLWLTGFAPRFEEAMLVWVLGKTPVLLLGNENMDYAKEIVQIDLECWLYQDFSLIDQDRSQSTDACTAQKSGADRRHQHRHNRLESPTQPRVATLVGAGHRPSNWQPAQQCHAFADGG
jgi:hypothetical protein